MSDKVKELIRSASNTGERVPSALFLAIKALEQLAAEVETLQGHQHPPPPRNLEVAAAESWAAGVPIASSTHLMSSPERQAAFQLAQAVRGFLFYKPTSGTGMLAVNYVELAALKDALEKFERGGT